MAAARTRASFAARREAGASAANAPVLDDAPASERLAKPASATSPGNASANASNAEPRSTRQVARPKRARRRLRKRTVATALVCVAALCLVASVALFANTAVGYIPFISLIALLALSFAYLIVLKRSLHFAEEGPSSGSVRGDVLQFALTVKNRSILPATRVEAMFHVSDAFDGEGRTELRRVSLPPRSKKVFDLGVRFDHIGFFQVGISQVGLYDPLGVFFSLRDNSTLHAVNILPRLVDIASFELSEQSLQESSKNIKTFINDGMDYSSVRDYRWGDPMKSIHWKLSSKSRESYFTRLYETPSTPGVAIFADFECDSLDSEQKMGVYDAIVESALSIEQYASLNGFDTRLLFVDERGESYEATGPFSDRLESLMRRFPPMHEGSGQEIVELFRKVSSSPNCPSNLVVCSASVTEELSNALAVASGPMRAPYLVAVYAGEDDHARLVSQVRRLEDARVPSALVRRASDLAAAGA